MKKKLNELQNIIKVKFKNLDLLQKSITHKSYHSQYNYEKLEFLGDRVLGLIISKKLLDLYPKEKEGILDKKFASLVNKYKCFKVGKNLKLHNFILIGNNKKKIKTIENKIISDCCEALIGAVFLDKGFLYTQQFVLKIWDEFIKNSDITLVDPKTQLQEYSLKKFKTLPIYKLISNLGPRHKPRFTVAVRLKNSNFIESTGSSKKNAEQSAANQFLKNLKE